MKSSDTAARNKLPVQALLIVGNETCERFSYYGMRAILMLYMTGGLIGMSNPEATGVAHLFYSAVYFLPLLGGWIADHWWGRYRTILYISLVYCVGNLVLAMAVGSRMGLYAGLLLIALGAGGIKPCVSAFVGDQFCADQQHLLPRVYGLFYWAINLGCFFAFGLIPTVRQNYGYQWAFGVPGFFMLLATLIFWLGRRRYTMMPPNRGQSKQAGFFKVLLAAWQQRRRRQPGQAFLDAALGRFTRSEVDGAKAVAGILMVFATVPAFWALFDQTSTTWVIQGKSMAPLTLFSFYLDPASWKWLSPVLLLFFSVTPNAPGMFAFSLDAERIQTLGPLLVLILIPLFTFGLYPLLEKLGMKPTPLRRMSAGMALAAVAFLVVGWIQTSMDRLPAGQPLSIAWQTIPYILLEAGEVLLSTTGLEFAFSQSPKSVKSTIMSFWLVTVGIGNLMVAGITSLSQQVLKLHNASHQFYFYALLMFVVTGAFILCATRYREQTFTEEPAPEAGPAPDKQQD